MKPNSERGLVCGNCGSSKMGVLYTRRRIGCIVRKRRCDQCGKQMLTRERPAGVPDAAAREFHSCNDLVKKVQKGHDRHAGRVGQG